MITIKLQRAEWAYDPAAPLGPRGGFGEVFAGASPDGLLVAVKRLHLRSHEIAHRELRMAEELSDRSLEHVMPFLDAGQDANSDLYYLVMPKAERSLAQHLEAEGTLDELEAIEILLDITNGLLEVSDIVHRDLKPANVLKHAERWKIADFGIAKFVEESTSIQTLRHCLTPQYAAPEQWKGDHVTNTTDVYALGCIAHCLLTGSPPFSGPGEADYQRQHTLEAPPLVPGARPQFQSVIGMMLRKEPLVRPSVARVRQMLLSVDASKHVELGRAALAKVGQSIADEIAHAEARAVAEKAEKERRSEAARAATALLDQLACELCEAAVANAPHAIYRRGPMPPATTVHQLSLGSGVLFVTMDAWGNFIEKEILPQCGWDVLAGAAITVEIPNKYGRSASLWFTNAAKGNDYRWYELSFAIGPHNPLLAQVRGRLDSAPNPAPPRQLRFRSPGDVLRALAVNSPFSLRPGPDADAALARSSSHRMILATEPTPVDFEAKESFIDRWLSLFAEAAAGRLANHL